MFQLEVKDYEGVGDVLLCFRLIERPQNQRQGESC